MRYFLRDKKKSKLILDKIKQVNPKSEIKIMEVCGTHTQTIAKFGLRNILPENIKLTSGPGCPVCVTSSSEIDLAIELTKKNILTTFGDMYRVPGTKCSLSDTRSDVRVVYSINETIKIAKKNLGKEVVHFAIGFETTAPFTAVEILENQDLNNFSIICSHRLIPPAMEFLLASGGCKIDGFLCPGHVSTIIGSRPYEPIVKKFNRPCVVTGFEPNDVLLGVYMILKQLKSGECKVEIEYKRSVRPEGNLLALRKLYEVFEVCDKGWRGIGLIPNSGLKLKKEFEKFDAQKKFNLSTKNAVDIKPGCKCGEMLKGLTTPKDCPLFKKKCTPQTPVGPCMVSVEGACNVAFRYGY